MEVVLNSTVLWKLRIIEDKIVSFPKYDDKPMGTDPNAPTIIVIIDTFFGLHILVANFNFQVIIIIIM